jgi:hypothetical protein
MVQVLNDASIDLLIRRKCEEGFSIEVGCLVRVGELRPPQEVQPSVFVFRGHDLAVSAFRARISSIRPPNRLNLGITG